MAPHHRSIIRRSLNACTAEGMAAEVVGACCGGAALTGWALHLGMDAALVGLVAALPIVAQVMQVFGALLTARFGHRRTALVAIALSRQAFLPLALCPVLPLGVEGRRTLLLAAAGAHHGLGIVANNAWNAWMAEMVPASVRGRYFGRRTAVCTVAGGASALVAGLALDHRQRGAGAGPVLQAMALTACLAGALSVWLMSRQHSAPLTRGGACHEYRPAAVRRSLLPIRAVLRPWADPATRRVLAYSVAWNGACGLSVPFFGLYLLRDLGTGYAVLAAEGAGLAAAKVVTASAWGRAVDGRGVKRVLVGCTAGLALSPLAWIACSPGRLWPLVLETAIGGVLLGGHAVGSFALPLAIAPRRERPFYLAAVSVAGGAAFAVTSAAGGALASAPGAMHATMPMLFVGSTVLRFAALGTAFALPSTSSRHDAALPAVAAAADEQLRKAA